MLINDLPITMKISAESLHKILEDQLRNQAQREFEFRLPVVGALLLRLSQMVVEKVKCANQGVAVEISGDLSLQVAGSGRTALLGGRLYAFVHVLIQRSADEILETRLSIVDLKWIGIPKLNIGRAFQPKRGLQRLLEMTIPRFEKEINRRLSKVVNKVQMESEISRRLFDRFRYTSDSLAPSRIQIKILQLIIVDDHLELHTNLSTELVKALEDVSYQVPRVELSAEGDSDAPWTRIKVGFNLLNAWIEANHVLLNQRLSLPTEIRSLRIGSDGEYLICAVIATALPETEFYIKLKTSLTQELQLIELGDLEMHAEEKTGMLLKALLRTTRRFLKAKIKKSFPIRVSPMLAELKTQVVESTPESVIASFSKDMILHSITYTSVACTICLSVHLELEMISQRSAVTDPEI